jgi:hypothetical protein
VGAIGLRNRHRRRLHRAAVHEPPRPGSRRWFLLAAAMVIVSITFVSVSSQLHGAEQKIQDANQRFIGLNGEQRDKEADEELLKSVETEKTERSIRKNPSMKIDGSHPDSEPFSGG